MAGLAIGLAQTATNLFPQHASTIAVVIFGAVTIFETIGPPIAAYAFRLAGEPNGGGKGEDPKNMVRTSEASLTGTPPETRF